MQQQPETLVLVGVMAPANDQLGREVRTCRMSTAALLLILLLAQITVGGHVQAQSPDGIKTSLQIAGEIQAGIDVEIDRLSQIIENPASTPEVRGAAHVSRTRLRTLSRITQVMGTLNLAIELRDDPVLTVFREVGRKSTEKTAAALLTKILKERGARLASKFAFAFGIAFDLLDPVTTARDPEEILRDPAASDHEKARAIAMIVDFDVVTDDLIGLIVAAAGHSDGAKQYLPRSAPRAKYCTVQQVNAPAAGLRAERMFRVDCDGSGNPYIEFWIDDAPLGETFAFSAWIRSHDKPGPDRASIRMREYVDGKPVNDRTRSLEESLVPLPASGEWVKAHAFAKPTRANSRLRCQVFFGSRDGRYDVTAASVRLVRH